jgi:hypothetical protein
MPLFLILTHKQLTLSEEYTTALLCFPKNLIPWRDSNPGLLFLRRIRCPLRQGNLKFKTVYVAVRTGVNVCTHMCFRQRR